MIIEKRGKITSDYFEVAKMLRKGLSESKQEDYVSWKWRKHAGRDFSDLELATAIQYILFCKKGAAELSRYAIETNLLDKDTDYQMWENIE